MKIRSHKELEVYKMDFNAAKDIFELSRNFPKEEKYSLTDQIRRSSRSVCANLTEAFRKSIQNHLLQKSMIVKPELPKHKSGLIFP